MSIIMARKTHKDYHKEYQDVLLKEMAIENRIVKRTLEMCDAHPNVTIPPVIEDSFKKFGYTTGEFKEGIEEKGMTADVLDYLHVMKCIEDYNERNANVRQGKLFNFK
jgi:hypothetical protein